MAYEVEYKKSENVADRIAKGLEGTGKAISGMMDFKMKMDQAQQQRAMFQKQMEEMQAAMQQRQLQTYEIAGKQLNDIDSNLLTLDSKQFDAGWAERKSAIRQFKQLRNEDFNEELTYQQKKNLNALVGGQTGYLAQFNDYYSKAINVNDLYGTKKETQAAALEAEKLVEKIVAIAPSVAPMLKEKREALKEFNMQRLKGRQSLQEVLNKPERNRLVSQEDKIFEEIAGDPTKSAQFGGDLNKIRQYARQASQTAESSGGSTATVQGLKAKPSQETIKELDNAASSLRSANLLQKRYKQLLQSKDSQRPGALAGRANNLLSDAFGVGSFDYQAFRSAAQLSNFAKMKEQSGVQYSDKQLSFMQAALPNELKSKEQLDATIEVFNQTSIIGYIEALGRANLSNEFVNPKEVRKVLDANRNILKVNKAGMTIQDLEILMEAAGFDSKANPQEALDFIKKLPRETQNALLSEMQ